MDDEGELRLQVADQLVVRRHKLAALALGEHDVEAVVKRAPRLRGNIDSAVEQRVNSMEHRHRVQDVSDERAGVPDTDQLLALRLRKRVGDLVGEIGGGDQTVDAPPVVVAELEGSRGERGTQHPGRGDGSVDDVLHVSSSSPNKALIVPMSMSPWRR